MEKRLNEANRPESIHQERPWAGKGAPNVQNSIWAVSKG